MALSFVLLKPQATPGSCRGTLSSWILSGDCPNVLSPLLLVCESVPSLQQGLLLCSSIISPSQCQLMVVPSPFCFPVQYLPTESQLHPSYLETVDFLLVEIQIYILIS